MAIQISHRAIQIDDIANILISKEELTLSEEASQAILKCRKYLDEKINEEGAKYYGVNTGFGSLCDVEISKSEINQLQENLVMSHACGMGDEVPQEIVRIMLLLKIQSLSYGHSGAAIETVERLIAMFNENVLPVVYTQGSLGASGDLAPLAHISLPLLGKGEVRLNGEKMKGESLENTLGWKPLQLQSKEGLALLNGTQFMSAYGVYLLLEGKKIMHNSNLIAAMSIDGYDCRIEPFNALVHKIRPHHGQITTAEAILNNLKDSQIANQEKSQVQDPYSFRCIPQVHGASMDTMDYVERVITTEINSVTDNPNVFPEEDEIISAGNFHGQPLALVLDFLKLALAELGNISERRVYLLLSGNRGLPVYLSPKPGLHSGMMIPQYTAASIVSKNKQLCTPASSDSIPSSNGQEDHVSMGANGAVQCLEILDNVKSIIAIELMTAAQALDCRKPLRSSTKIEAVLNSYRKEVTKLDEDRVLYTDIQTTKSFLNHLIIK
ncbi:MAG: histidine ammonia-lyase [Flavobacteriaceae bacterium]|jgi:histidine ammonia-lyase